MEARPNSEIRSIDFSREPLGWPGDGDEVLIDTPNKTALDIIHEPPTGATLLSSVLEDPNPTQQGCFESGVQGAPSFSSTSAISNDFTHPDLEAFLTTEFERISASNAPSCLQGDPSLPGTSSFGSFPSVPSISLQTHEGDHIRRRILFSGDTFQGEPKRPKLNHQAFPSPPHFYEMVHPSDDYISLNHFRTDNTFNPIIYNDTGSSSSSNISHTMISHYPVDEDQGHIQYTIAANTELVPLTEAYQGLQMEPRTYPNASTFESPHAAFPALPAPHQSLSPGQEFLLGGSAQRNGEISMLRLQTALESFPHIPSQMTAKNAHPTSLFVTNSTFPAPSANGTTRSIGHNEQGASPPIFSPECYDNTPLPLTNQLIYPQLDVPIDMLHLGNAGSPGESTQPDVPQPTLGKEKFVYKHTLLEPIAIPNTITRDDSSIGSHYFTPDPSIDRTVHRSPQNLSVERRQEKGKHEAGELPISECKSSINRRQTLKPYYRPIRAKSPEPPAISTPYPIDSIDLTTDSPEPCPSPASIPEVGTYLTWPAGMGETARAFGRPVNIHFNTRIEANKGVAFSELKRLNFGLSAVSEILDNPNEMPLYDLPSTVTELFVLVEWPVQLGPKNNQKHKVAKTDRPINRFSRVDILCKIAKRLYEFIRKEKTNPLDPNKLRIMSLNQQVDNKELWTVRIASNAQE